MKSLNSNLFVVGHGKSNKLLFTDVKQVKEKKEKSVKKYSPKIDVKAHIKQTNRKLAKIRAGQISDEPTIKELQNLLK